MSARRTRICLLTMALTVLGAIQGPLAAQEANLRDEVRPEAMADLAASGLSLSVSYPMPGEAVDVAAGVRNRGTAVSKVTVALFVGSSRIASRETDIKAGETRTVHFWWAPKQEGLTILTLRLDPDQKELAIDLRHTEISIEVVVATQPPVGTDFAVSNMELVEGQPSLLSATVQNHGTAAGSAPLILQVDDKVAAQRLVTLPAGGKQTIQIPWAAAEFHGRLSAEINPRFASREKKVDDNLLTRDLRPDVGLSVEGLSMSAAQFDPKRPRQITLSFRIVNIGRQPIKEAFRTAIFPGTIKPGQAQPLDTSYVTTNGLAAGDTVYVSSTIVSPLGEFEVRVETDADHAISAANRIKTVATAKFKNPTPSPGRWVSIGPRVMMDNGIPSRSNGRVTAIAIDPTSTSTIYVGAVGSGIWKTTDGGATWVPLTDSLPSQDIAAIAVDPSAPSRVYAAVPGMGIVGSTDGGMTWKQLSNDLGFEVRWGVMLVSPADSSVIYVATSSGIYRSGNFGVSWPPSNSRGEASDLVMDPANPNVLYAALVGDGIYKTTTGGVGGNGDWIKLVTGLPSSDISQITLALCQRTSSTVYAGYSRSSGFQLYRSTDAGSSWGLRTTAPFANLFNDAIGVDSVVPDTVYITGVGIYRSTDGGANFSTLSGTHGDHHAFVNDPVAASLIYVGDDGGIYQSRDSGDSWTFIGEGMTNAEFYDIADATTKPNVVIGGTQDNGNLKYDGSSTAWTQMDGFGDGATVDIDPNNDQILYGMGQGIDSLARSTDGGNSFSNISGGLPLGIGKGGCAAYNTHYQVHPSQPSTLLASPAGCGPLYQTTNPQPPGSWSALFTPPTGSIVRSAVDPSVNLYYAASTDGRLYAGPGGANFQNVFSHPLAARTLDVKIDPSDPSTVYVAFAGTGSGRIYRLRRSSAAPSTMTATDITSDLPSGLAIGQQPGTASASGGALAVDLLLPLTIYAGTNSGVYCGRTNDGGKTWYWTAYNNGMPPTYVVDLDIHPTTGVMRAATYGRSAFEVNTDDPLGSLLGVEGKLTLLRVHEEGTGYGPPTDFIDVEVVAWLDSMPGRAFGFQLRDDASKGVRRGMLNILRDAFRSNRRVHFDYIRTGFRNGIIVRVWFVPGE